jgi:hypothetical protein
MIGQHRMANIRELTERVLREDIPGDLMETGVWRGGACIFMRAILRAHGITDRRVIVADSFDGLPRPDPEKYPADAFDRHFTFRNLAVSVDEVRSNFARYGLLDDQVVFVKGWFKDTLPTVAVDRLAVLRLDGDMYGSTWDALTSLYDKVSLGGFIIIDDFDLIGAHRAVMDFRAVNAISEPVVMIDRGSVYWRKIVNSEDRLGGQPAATRQTKRRPGRPRTKAAPVPPVRVRGLASKLTVARLRRARPPSATLLTIYRPAHVERTLEKVAQARAANWGIRLWALEKTDPSLAEYTVGEGPGGRFALINRLANSVDWRDWIVIADDDTRISYPWTLATFLTVCDKLGFDLAQPAHAEGSHHVFKVNEQQPEYLARATTWVEAGPILALSPRLRSRVIPFPETTLMGWGTEILWTKFLAEGFHLGVVDGVPVDHEVPPGATYDMDPEIARARELSAEHDFPGVEEFARTLRPYLRLPFRKVRAAPPRTRAR